MIEAFVITLREGVEAALVVCLILSYLRKTGRKDLEKPLFWGFGVAVALSLAGAVAIKATGFDPEGRVEGIVLAVSAALVLWLVIWMWLHGKKLKQITEAKLGSILEKPSGGQGFGIFLFSFLTVFREGVETVLMLSAVNFTTDAILAFAGGIAGVVLAVIFGVAFFKGSIKVNLRKFFAVTTIILLIFVVQLVISSLHEFSEAGDLPVSQDYMRIAGPIIRNNVFFVIAILILPFALLIGSSVQAAPAANPADERKERAMSRAGRLGRIGFASIAIVTIGLLGWTYAHEKKGLEMEPPTVVFAKDGAVTIATADLDDKKLHRYGVKIGDTLVRFLAIRIDDKYVTTFDACEICKDLGYVQQGDRVVCLNCTADINGATLGEGGGCNPIPLPSGVKGAFVRIEIAELTKRKEMFQNRFEAQCPKCKMKFGLQDAGAVVDGQPRCSMKECQP